MVILLMDFEDHRFEKLRESVIRVARVCADTVLRVSNLDSWVNTRLEGEALVTFLVLILVPHVGSH